MSRSLFKRPRAKGQEVTQFRKLSVRLGADEHAGGVSCFPWKICPRYGNALKVTSDHSVEWSGSATRS